MRSLSWPTRWVGSPLRVLLIVVYSVLTFMSIISFITQRTVYEAITTVVVACAALFHPAHREFCTAIIGASFFLFLLTPPGIVPVSTAVAVFYITYLVSAYSPPKWRRVWLPVIIVGVGLAIVMNRTFIDENLILSADSPRHMARLQLYPMMAAFSLIGLGFFWLLGLQRRRQDADRQALKDRAELSAVVERTRIAREMHDIVAHNLSAVIALADGARYAAAKDPQVASDTLGTIAETSREALKQMRGLLSVLRDDAVRDPNAVGVSAVEGLLADAHRTGLTVTSTGFDELPEGLPQLTQSTLYRVVQELLTNMLKYSPDRHGTLTAEVTDRRIRIISANKQGDSESDPGFGLIGMRERVHALGGTMQVSRDEEFTVTVELPR